MPPSIFNPTPPHLYQIWVVARDFPFILLCSPCMLVLIRFGKETLCQIIAYLTCKIVYWFCKIWGIRTKELSFISTVCHLTLWISPQLNEPWGLNRAFTVCIKDNLHWYVIQYFFAALNAELVAKDKENKHTSYVSGSINYFALKLKLLR